MSNVRVVTDSTADIPEQLRQAAGIEVVPLSVLFGTEAYKDKVEISHDEFIQRLKTVGRTLPTTAAPSPGQFEEVYSRLADEGAEGIVSVHLSEKLSGTIAAARIAAESVADRVKVEVLDSRSISLGLGFLALEGARIAAQGGDLETVAEAIRRMAPNIHIIFFADTLEFLQKGGRIGRAAAIAGSILSLKPLMRLDEGAVVPHERTRTRSKAIDGLVRFAKDFPHIRQMGALRSGDGDIQALLDRLNAGIPGIPRDRIIMTDLSPVIAVHLGPGALGVIIDTSEGRVPA
jgi:DegV family protein with EDD domain